MDKEFEDWKASAASFCAKKKAPLPDETTLEMMFDDGHDPEDTARHDIRMKYEHPGPRQAHSDNLAGMVAQMKAAD